AVIGETDGGQGSPLSRLAARVRRYSDQIITFFVLIAIWQILSMTLGIYWVSSPWGVLTRFIAGILGGDLLINASYTFVEALIGFLLGAIPAILLPFLLRRFPMATAIIDPVMVGGYGAPKLALASLFVLWFGIGMESKVALVAITVFFIVY